MLKLFDELIHFVRKFPVFNKLPLNFYKFFIVGSTGVVINISIFNILYYILNFKLELFDFIIMANVVSTLLTTIYGYVLNKSWSFEDKSPDITKQFSKYLILAIINNTLNAIMVGILTAKKCGPSSCLPPTLAIIIATAMLTISNYFLYKLIVFKIVQVEPIL